MNDIVETLRSLVRTIIRRSFDPIDDWYWTKSIQSRHRTITLQLSHVSRLAFTINDSILILFASNRIYYFIQQVFYTTRTFKEIKVCNWCINEAIPMHLSLKTIPREMAILKNILSVARCSRTFIKKVGNTFCMSL